MRPIATILVMLTLLACDAQESAKLVITDQSAPPVGAQPEVSFSAGSGGGGGGGIGGVGPGGGMRRGNVAVGESERVTGAQYMPPPQPGSVPSQITDTPQQAMIIKNGQATIEVDSLELAIARVTQLAQKLGGVVANSSIQTGKREFRTASVVLRIPSAQFDAAMSGLSPIGKLETQNVGSEDVTEQFVDMAARMKNAKRLEERLINLLATRTGKLEDVLAVERELARVREQIERYEGQLRYLRTRAAISTLTLNLHEPYPILSPPGGSNVITQAFRRAWRNFVGVVATAIASLGVIIPLLALAVAIVLLLRKLGLLPHLRRSPKEPPSAPPQG